jgi:hypothetical protein
MGANPNRISSPFPPLKAHHAEHLSPEPAQVTAHVAGKATEAKITGHNPRWPINGPSQLPSEGRAAAVQLAALRPLHIHVPPLTPEVHNGHPSA